MKPDLQFTLLCDDIRIEHNGKFMLLGLFDHISAKSFPLIHPRMVVVNRWGKGQGAFVEKTRMIYAPESKVIAESNPVKFELKSLDALHNIISEFKNIKFEKEGKYWVELLLDDELVRSFNFYVRKSVPKPK